MLQDRRPYPAQSTPTTLVRGFTAYSRLLCLMQHLLPYLPFFSANSNTNWSSLGGTMVLQFGFGCLFSMAVLSSFENPFRKCYSRHPSLPELQTCIHLYLLWVKQLRFLSFCYPLLCWTRSLLTLPFSKRMRELQECCCGIITLLFARVIIRVLVRHSRLYGWGGYCTPISTIWASVVRTGTLVTIFTWSWGREYLAA